MDVAPVRPLPRPRGSPLQGAGAPPPWAPRGFERFHFGLLASASHPGLLSSFSGALALVLARKPRRAPSRSWAGGTGSVDGRSSTSVRGRRHRTARAARSVSVVVEKSVRQELPKCDARWMEQLLQARAAEVLFNGVERTEPASEDLIYLYFPSLDIGPYSTQVRMTCRINLKPQRAEVQVLEINPGLRDKRTGDVEYQKDLDKLLEANAEIVLRWQDDPRSNGLRIVQQALQRFKYYLPGWFPVPDSVTEAVLRTFITSAINAGQVEVFRALQQEAAASGPAAGVKST